MRAGQPQTASVKYVEDVDEVTHEVRHGIRYPLRAPATFSWHGLDGAAHQGRGSTRDISEGGAYIVTRSCPPLRAMIDLAIRFSSLPGPAPSYRLELSGRVVRIEPLLHSKESWGFAVASTQPILQDADDPEEESRSAE